MGKFTRIGAGARSIVSKSVDVSNELFGTPARGGSHHSLGNSAQKLTFPRDSHLSGLWIAPIQIQENQT